MFQWILNMGIYAIILKKEKDHGIQDLKFYFYLMYFYLAGYKDYF